MRARMVLVVVAMVAVLAMVAVAGRDAGAGASTRADAAAIAEFRAGFEPIAYDWGRLEIQGMRPSVADLQRGEGLPAETIAGQAALWASELEALDARLRRLPADGELDGIRSSLRRSLRLYELAVERFGVAAAASGAARDDAIRAGIDHAERGAAQFSSAQRSLDALAAAAGLAVEDRA